MTRRQLPPISSVCPGPSLTGLLLVTLISLASAVCAAGRSNEPLDFRYRVLGSEIAVGIVFDDGRDVFIQPLDPALAPRLRVNDAPFVRQGPYLVVRGLANRLSLGADGDRLRSATIEYAGPGRSETIARDCAPGTRDLQSRLRVPFGTGALEIEPGGVDRLSQMLAQARGADRVTLVAFADRAQSPIAQRRIARVRELLVEGGVPAGSIDHRVQPPAASTLEVIATRRVDHGCPPVTQAVAPAAPEFAAPKVAAPEPAELRGAPSLSEQVAVASPPPPPMVPIAPATPTTERAAPAQSAVDPLRLLFLPNSTVQATLRSFLKLHGVDVEFKSMPLLMVEDVAEVNGADLRDVLRRALVRLGLRGELHGNRLLVVELAN